MILNTSCDAAKVPENLKALYAYINDPKNTSGDALMTKIDDRVRQYSGSNWRWMQVTFEEHVKHMTYRAREEALKEGEEKLKAAAAKLKATGMAPEEIAEITDLSPEEINDL